MTTFWWIVIFMIVVASAAAAYYFYVRRSSKEKPASDESYVEALRALLDGNQTLAFLKLKETVTGDSNNIDAYLRLVALFRQRGMHSKALQLSTDLSLRQTIGPADKVRVLYSLADDHLAAGRLEAAEGILQNLAQMSGQKSTATKKLVELYERMERWEDAFKTGHEFLNLSRERDKSSLAKYKLRLGERMMANGDLHKARLEFKEALKLDPKSAEAVLGLGDAYEKEGRLEDAVKAWRQMIDVSPTKAELVFGRLKKALFDLGRFGEIEDLYNKVLERDKDNLAALTGLATLAEKKGDTLLAVETYNQILETKPDYRPALAGLLKLYRDEKKFGEAAQVIERTVKTLLPIDK
ncbi:MAG: tetratricopeptide repeat protein [candidate division Zixibacteria bacterium]|nr:tetratricopeptide repeat protein [candidate division Zixibacteria bacterium]MBU1469109.1 tetratricopeptide repeat protein [candidate division Zixibacteria bacterium]MBU2624890.1 tetratricopeptide repeat protein [candidate division Zixibacteria bacterium]